MASEAEIGLDGEVHVINTTEVPADQITRALRDQGYGQIADAMGQWVTRVHGDGPRRKRLGGIWDRDRWLPPEFAVDKMRMARAALSDDIIGGAADGTEGLALGSVSIFTDDDDEEDIWNQIAADINLDDQFRKAWRALYTDSQYVFCVWWDTKSYKVRGKTDKGNERRQTFDNLVVPAGITFLDTTKVVPVGLMMFGQERLAYIATGLEAIRMDAVIAARDGGERPKVPIMLPTGYSKSRKGSKRVPADIRQRLEHRADADLMLDDPLTAKVIEGRYRPDWFEQWELEQDGIDCSNLFLLNPNMVFRHTLTKQDYQRFAEVRMERVFPLLDLKAQLRQMDRAHLVGGTNFIVLITKGTDQLPAVQQEITALQQSAFALASVPVVVGDHRLKIEIITPKLDTTLNRGRHDTIDVRIFASSWQTFIPTGQDVDDPLKLGAVIAKGLTSRRLMMRRTFEASIIDRIRRSNEQLKGRAKIKFHPASISLQFDSAWASFLMDLRDANEISRETELSQFDLDQKDEARQREREKRKYDDVFQTQVPYSTPNPANNNSDPAGGGRAAARRAGRRLNKGAGAAPGSGQGQPARNPRRRANSDSPVRAELEDMGKGELLLVARELEIPGRSRMGVGALLEAIAAREAELADEEEGDDDGE